MSYTRLGTYYYQIPSNVTSLGITLTGAGGGTGPTGTPGRGQQVGGTLPVQVGQRLQVNVGGTPNEPGSGGYNGGANGGHGTLPGGGGGGGASDIRTDAYGLADRVIVAGGGGGTGSSSGGGDAGNPTGEAGLEAGSGAGGSQVQGGGGGWTVGVTAPGQRGVAGGGGGGGSGAFRGGGGGGAGYFGGGGGGGGGGDFGPGGGGGSSYAGPSVTNVNFGPSTNQRDGSVTITPGPATPNPTATVVDTRARFNGNVATNGSALSHIGFTYGTDQAAVQSGSGEGVTTVTADPSTLSPVDDKNPTPVTTTITGLTPNTTYYLSLTATNAVGTSTSQAVAFSTATPGPPSNVTGHVSPGQSDAVDLGWDAPGSAGGSPITGYTIAKRSRDDGEYTPVTAGSCAGIVTTTNCQTTGLGGGFHTFVVAAVNSAGTGAASPPTPSILLNAPGASRFATPGTYSYVVPADVDVVAASLAGGGGGDLWTSSTPGRGQLVSARIPVSPGQVLQVNAGGGGFLDAVSSTGGGGFNGGGGAVGAGGGGASDVRTGGYGLSDRILVAGGGGGVSTSAWEGDWTNGGGGGYPTGGTYTDWDPQHSGGGGSQTEGGRGGLGVDSRTSGTDGSAGQGGNGGLSPRRGYGAGGGGGGYYGGGGGGAGTGGEPWDSDTGGGGGSSYAGPSVTNVNFGPSTNRRDGSVTITPGPATPNPTATVVDTRARFNGNVATNGSALSHIGFTYGTDQAAVQSGSGEGVTTVTADPSTLSPADDKNPTPVTTTITGLTPNTTYYLSLTATSAVGTSTSQAVAFSTATPGPPSNVTGRVSPGQPDTVDLNWDAPGSAGGSPITGYTIAKRSRDDGEYTPVTAGSCAGIVTTTNCQAAGLLPTTYYIFTVAAVNSAGTGASSRPSPPISSTDPPTITGITPSAGTTRGGTSVAISGTFLAGASVTIGTSPCTGVSVDATGTQLTCTTQPGVDGAQDVVVTTDGGWATAARAFTYISQLPTVTTDQVSSITRTSAVLNATITPHGGDTTATIQMQELGRPSTTITLSPVAGGEGPTVRTHTATNLQPNTIYFYKALASNSVGEASGDIVYFLTPNG